MQYIYKKNLIHCSSEKQISTLLGPCTHFWEGKTFLQICILLFCFSRVAAFFQLKLNSYLGCTEDFKPFALKVFFNLLIFFVHYIIYKYCVYRPVMLPQVKMLLFPCRCMLITYVLNTLDSSLLPLRIGLQKKKQTKPQYPSLARNNLANCSVQLIGGKFAYSVRRGKKHS